MITLFVEGVWIVMRYFLFEKQNFNGLLKVIRIQITLLYSMYYIIVYFDYYYDFNSNLDNAVVPLHCIFFNNLKC